MMRTLTLWTGLVTVLAFAGCGDKAATGGAAPAGGTTAAAEELNYKCPCGKTATAKKGDKAPECCGKPMLAS